MAADRLPEAVAVAVVHVVHGALAAHPHRVGKRLMFDLDGRYSVRRGMYRVIYSVGDGRSVVVVVRIAHRADAHS